MQPGSQTKGFNLGEPLSRQHRAMLLLEIDAAKDTMILKWPGLQASHKIAWEYLAKQTCMGRRLHCVTATDVGNYEGRTHASGMRSIRALEEIGLIAVRGKGPSYEIELLDHTDLPLPRVEWDGQLELFERDTIQEDERASGPVSDPPTDGSARPFTLRLPRQASVEGTTPAIAPSGAAAAQDAPPAASQASHGTTADRSGDVEAIALQAILDQERLRVSVDANAKRPVRGNAIADASTEPRDSSRNREPRARASSDLRRLERNTKSLSSVTSSSESSGICSTAGAQTRGGRGNAIAEASTEPRRGGMGAIGGEVCEALARLPTPAEQHARIESLANYFRRRVKDPKLRIAPCLRLASAVVEGRVQEADAMRLLAYIDQNREAGTLRGEPWMYFTGTAKKLLSQAESVPAWRDTGE